MRAREFIAEQQGLPPETKEPLRYTYTLPGLSSSDPYNTYRVLKKYIVTRVCKDRHTTRIEHAFEARQTGLPAGSPWARVETRKSCAPRMHKAFLRATAYSPVSW